MKNHFIDFGRLILKPFSGELYMHEDEKIKVSKEEDRLMESNVHLEIQINLEARMAMARELQEMGLKTESIERILSIRINSGQ